MSRDGSCHDRAEFGPLTRGCYDRRSSSSMCRTTTWQRTLPLLPRVVCAVVTPFPTNDAAEFGRNSSHHTPLAPVDAGLQQQSITLTTSARSRVAVALQQHRGPGRACSGAHCDRCTPQGTPVRAGCAVIPRWHSAAPGAPAINRALFQHVVLRSHSPSAVAVGRRQSTQASRWGFLDAGEGKPRRPPLRQPCGSGSGAAP